MILLLCITLNGYEETSRFQWNNPVVDFTKNDPKSVLLNVLNFQIVEFQYFRSNLCVVVVVVVVSFCSLSLEKYYAYFSNVDYS